MAQALNARRTTGVLPIDSVDRINSELARLESEWAGIPELAAEWDGWDEHARLSFAVDWPVQEDALGRLLDRERRRVLNASQRERLAALKALIARHRPTLERLLESTR